MKSGKPVCEERTCCYSMCEHLSVSSHLRGRRFRCHAPACPFSSCAVSPSVPKHCQATYSAPRARHGKQLLGGGSGERRVPRRGGAGLAAGEVMLCSPQGDAGWGHVLPALLACFCGQTEQVGLCEYLGSRDGLSVTRGKSGLEVLPATCLRNREIVGFPC